LVRPVAIFLPLYPWIGLAVVIYVVVRQFL
jgi:hypothetical protein